MSRKSFYEEGAIIVLFRQGVTAEQAKQLVQSFGLTFAEQRDWGDTINMSLVSVPVGEERKWIIEFNKKRDIVQLASLNHKYRLLSDDETSL